MLPPLGYSVSPPLLISPSAFHPRSDLLLSQILAANSRATDESTVFIKLAASSWMKSPAVVGGARVVLLLHRCHLRVFIHRCVDHVSRLCLGKNVEYDLRFVDLD